MNIEQLAESIGREVAKNIVLGGWKENNSCVLGIAAIVIAELRPAVWEIEKQITELQAANTREVERRRELEQLLAHNANGPAACCLDNTHSTNYSDGYSLKCKTHGTRRTADTGWNR